MKYLVKDIQVEHAPNRQYRHIRKMRNVARMFINGVYNEKQVADMRKMFVHEDVEVFFTIKEQADGK